MQRYFTPIDSGGLITFVQGGEGAGWYQLPVVGATLTTLAGLTVPPGTTGLLLVANSAVTIANSPAAAAGGASSGIALAAGSTIILPGLQWITDLCFLLPASGCSFSLQYLQGDIGPLPIIS